MAVFNMTIVRSGLLTIIVTLVLVEINPKTRMTKEQWLQIPVQTVKSAVSRRHCLRHGRYYPAV